MGNFILNFIAVLSGLITIITGCGLTINAKIIKDLGLTSQSIIPVFVISLVITFLCVGSSVIQHKSVKSQIQIGGKKNKQKMG